jgi:hypothetical protein
VKQTLKQWLSTSPWESVIAVNKALCQAQKVEPTTRAAAQEKARRLWEGATARKMTLKEVLDLCRECHEITPFTFNNGNTFAAIGRALVEDWLNILPPVEGQIVRTTIGHYIVGLIGRKELLQVLLHFEEAGQRETAPVDRMSAPVTATVQH